MGIDLALATNKMDKKSLMRKAIIDLGTNTFNLLIAEFSNDNWHVIFNQKIGVLLGMGASIQKPSQKMQWLEVFKPWKNSIIFVINTEQNQSL